MKNRELKIHVYNNVYQNSSNGYILTHPDLAFEMVSIIPNCIIESPSKTFLDPICKSGTFLFEIVERLYDANHSIKNIESRIYTIDSNYHSLNVANSTIKKSLNKLSGSFKIDYKYEWVERYYNRLIYTISSGKYTTLEEFMNIIMIDKNHLNIMSEFKRNVSEFIKEYEKVSKLDSRLFGEVFTPRQLIDEILNTLPENVWKNPNLKWLDPSVGVGNYPSAILDRLMVSLVDFLPNENDRRKHILENMLYMCDISSKNLFLLYMLFDRNNDYNLNVFRGSFLSEDFDTHMNEIWKVDKFDIILGNPPYNENGTGTGNSVWHLFVEKSEIISSQYISFIHPSSWRMPLREGDRFYKSSQFIKNNAVYVRVLKKEESKKYFGLSIKVDFYLLDKKRNTTFTIIENDVEKTLLDLNSNVFIPSFDFTKFNRLINSDDKCEVVYSYKYDPRNSYVSKIKDDVFKYPLVHTTPKNGNRYLYSSVNDKGHFGIPKVIFGDSGINDVIIDMDGEYGMTQHAIGLKVSSVEEAQLIKEALMGEKFQFFLESIMWGNFQIDWRLFNHLNRDFWKEFKEPSKNL